MRITVHIFLIRILLNSVMNVLKDMREMIQKRRKLNEEYAKERRTTEMGYSSKVGPFVLRNKTSLPRLLESVLTTPEYTDVNVTILDIVYKCHMLMLSRHSAFFRRIERENQSFNIHLFPENVSVEGFGFVYSWILCNKANFTRREIIEIHKTASYLEVSELVEKCWAFLSDEKHSEEEIFQFFLHAQRGECILIEKMLLSRICKFFLILVSTKQFVELSFIDLVSLLSSSFIAVNSEMEVFLSGIRWLNHDWLNRRQHMMGVLNCVRFPILPPLQLIELNGFYDAEHFDADIMRIVLENVKVKELIHNALSNVTTEFWACPHNGDRCGTLDIPIQLGLAQRTWIDDPLKKEFNSTNVYTLFSNFLNYLNKLRISDPDYYKTFRAPPAGASVCHSRVDTRETSTDSDSSGE